MLCRVCNSQITPFMSFGKMPIANGFLKKNKFNKEYFFEMKTCFCNDCKTFQLYKQPKPELMFHKNYPFFSSLSKNMINHFYEAYNEIQKKYLTDKKNSFVVEIGSNDGIFLQNFKTNKIPHLGIEPSKNVANLSKKNGIETISSFFTNKLTDKIIKTYGHADIIFSANVMCHLPNIKDIAKGISNLLKPNGVLIFEDPYLGDVIKKTSFDQIYDEHVFLFSAHSVKNIFSLYGMELFDVKYLKTHGGSMRYYLCKKGSRKISIKVKKIILDEKKIKLHLKSTYDLFKKNCYKFKNQFKNLLLDLKKNNKKVYGYGATSKSTTILNFCNIDDNLIEFISDITPLKQNKYTPGKHIPVKDYSYFKKKYPDYAILFAWNHIDEILKKEKSFSNSGGKWIVPFPFKK